MAVRVLLCCGAGFSSGFLAQRARQYCKSAQLDMTIDARSESVISEYVGNMDVLLIGPHYESSLSKFRVEYEPKGIKVALIPTDIYSSLDGTRLVQLVENLLNETEE